MALLPRKRGPKRPWNRPAKEKERLVVAIHRRLGKTPIHIQLMLQERGIFISVSGIRNILGVVSIAGTGTGCSGTL